LKNLVNGQGGDESPKKEGGGREVCIAVSRPKGHDEGKTRRHALN